MGEGKRKSASFHARSQCEIFGREGHKSVALRRLNVRIMVEQCEPRAELPANFTTTKLYWFSQYGQKEQRHGKIQAPGQRASSASSRPSPCRRPSSPPSRPSR